MSGPGNNLLRQKLFGFFAGSGTELNRTAGQNPDPLLTLVSVETGYDLASVLSKYKQSSYGSPSKPPTKEEMNLAC
jgi:hypothetical protein